MKLGVSGFAWTANFEERHLSLLPSIRAMGFAANLWHIPKTL
jgi:hypothetical protein